MKKIEIFDPAMCCPTGVCGPSVDPELTRIASAVYVIEKKGYPIKRYNLANEPDAFVDNQAVQRLLMEKGPDCLPIVLLEGNVVKIGEYPTTSELSEWTGIDEKELSAGKPKIRLNIKLTPTE
jgi:hypothetical protein